MKRSEHQARNGADPEPNETLPAVETSTFAFHDPLPRQRDTDGANPLQGITSPTPVIEDISLDDALTAEGWQRIQEARPMHAAKLKRNHDHVLLPARREFQRVCQEEEEAQRKRNEFIVKESKEIDARQQQLQKERIATVAADEAELKSVDEALREAHLAAADRVAHAGGLYNPDHPDETCVLHVRQTAEAQTVETSGAPAPPPHLTDPQQIPPAMSWALTVAVGIMIGLSFGMMSGWLHPETLMRHLLIVLLFMLIGFGAAVGARFGILKIWRLLGKFVAENNRASAFVLTAALAVSGFVILADGFVEKEGLLKMARQKVMFAQMAGHTQAATGGSDGIYWLAGIIVIFGFVINYSIDGFNVGRNDELAAMDAGAQSTVSKAHTVSAQQETEDPRRKDPKVQAALHAIARVCILERRRTELVVRIAALSAPYEAKIAEMEAQRRLPSDQLPMAARQRIQDAMDRARDAQTTWNHMLDEALTLCEISGKR